jgi:hypothetical protein
MEALLTRFTYSKKKRKRGGDIPIQESLGSITEGQFKIEEEDVQ